MLTEETIPEIVSCTDDDDATEIDEEENCEKMYGPYPRAIPVPYISSDLQVPPAEQIDRAKYCWELRGISDYRDVGTPDEWIPRDGRLVRLTGRHPFNVEPPLSILHQYKFITPSSLHYVRNHGAVPDLKWDQHTVCIGGLVRKPLEISMDELTAMTYRELPVTLVCAGNRRKEQNMIRQTIGFNWGPSGVSTNVWRGVLLRDLLRMAGVSDSFKNTKGKHVEFVGVEDLPNKVGTGPFPQDPWQKLVKYGTSIPLARAMNPAYDVIIAYMANGELLQPDHGFPVRLIIPGYIGGRMIKWLKHINVIDHETTNHYHYHDNRIFPPHVTSEIAIRDGWWYRPEYIFNELNINSAISQPNHNTSLVIRETSDEEKKDDCEDDYYDIVGYAYTGGGRAITRVEVSIDMGLNWEVSSLDRKERPTPYGMYWCWIWWTYRVRKTDLSDCKEIWCRAWDESNNTQPMNPTWTLMGMGNNHVFRVKVHAMINDVGHRVLRFEHPTQPVSDLGTAHILQQECIINLPSFLSVFKTRDKRRVAG